MIASITLLLTLATAHQLVTLTDATFDAETKALTGQTHDWLVMFCSPERYKHCEALMPFWQEVDDELKDKFNVAFVDV